MAHLFLLQPSTLALWAFSRTGVKQHCPSLGQTLADIWAVFKSLQDTGTTECPGPAS